MPIPESTIKHLTVTPIEGYAFGAVASGIDCNTMTEQEFKERAGQDRAEDAEGEPGRQEPALVLGLRVGQRDGGLDAPERAGRDAAQGRAEEEHPLHTGDCSTIREASASAACLLKLRCWF